MKQSNTLLFLYSLSTAATLGYWVLALLTWRRRSHPVVAAVFYYAVFSCFMDIPLKILFWFYRHPAAHKSYYYVYWIFEPASDLFCLFIGYRLLCYLWESAFVRRFALWLFRLLAFTITGLLLVFLSNAFGLHLHIKGRHVFVADCCLHVAMCVMVLVLGVFRKSLGVWTENLARLIALGLAMMASSSLIASTLMAFTPHLANVAGFPLLGCIEILGALACVTIWCLAVGKTHPAEAVPTTMRPSLALSLDSLNTASDLLLDISRR